MLTWEFHFSFPLLYLLHRISCNVKFSQWEAQEADTRFLICDRREKRLMFYIDWFGFLRQKYFQRVKSQIHGLEAWPFSTKNKLFLSSAALVIIGNMCPQFSEIFCNVNWDIGYNLFSFYFIAIHNSRPSRSSSFWCIFSRLLHFSGLFLITLVIQ